MNLRAATPPPLTEAEVAEAEAELGVALPEEYRRYLLQVSAGGAVAELRKAAIGWWWADNRATRRELLPLPFPHPDSYAVADAAFDDREPRIENYPTDAAFLGAMKLWDNEYEEFSDRKTAGAVVAQEHGCGFSTLLVITGPLAGTLWWDGHATCDLIIPLSLDHATGARPITFGEWLSRDSWKLLPPGWG